MATKTHWKKLQNPDYLGTYALNPGEDMVLTISNIRREVVTGAEGKKEECSVCYFAENVKPMIINNTNAKTISKLAGSPYIEDWAGLRIQIGAERIKAYGDVMDALRVRPFHPKTDTISTTCADCGADIVGAGKLTPAETAAYTHQKYGRPLCARCATAEAERRKSAEVADTSAAETTGALDAAMEGQESPNATENQ